MTSSVLAIADGIVLVATKVDVRVVRTASTPLASFQDELATPDGNILVVSIVVVVRILLMVVVVVGGSVGQTVGQLCVQPSA